METMRGGLIGRPIEWIIHSEAEKLTDGYWNDIEGRRSNLDSRIRNLFDHVGLLHQTAEPSQAGKSAVGG